LIRRISHQKFVHPLAMTLTGDAVKLLLRRPASGSTSGIYELSRNRAIKRGPFVLSLRFRRLIGRGTL
jgi:hypothetical protein